MAQLNEHHRALLKQALDAKEHDGYSYDLEVFTPDPEEWFSDGSAVYEARGYGTRIACFGDTEDKFVLDLSHLGFDLENDWARGSWGNTEYCARGCLQDAQDREEYLVGMRDLICLGQFLSSRCPVHFTMLSGSNKGYFTMRVIPLTCDTNVDELLANENLLTRQLCALHVYSRSCVLVNYPWS